MNRLALLALVCSLAGCPATGTATGSAVVTTGPAPARPDPGYRPAPSAPNWDSTGWTLLGSQTVDGRTDRDVIRVAKRARWDKLTLVVSDSDLELLDLDIQFVGGQKWSPKLAYHFREGQRTRAIDLPGDDRQIDQITLMYRNTARGGRARVEIYGKNVRDGGVAYNPQPSQPPPPPPPPVEPPPPPQPSTPPDEYYTSRGWTQLGAQYVDGKRDRDIYVVGRRAGRIDVIALTVKESNVEIADLVVVFENGERWEPKFSQRMSQNARTKSIDVPGADRIIKHIEVKYANLRKDGKARLEIYGKDTKAGRDPKK